MSIYNALFTKQSRLSRNSRYCWHSFIHSFILLFM